MSKSKKAIIISVVSVVLVCVAVFVFFLLNNNNLSGHGQTALSYARNLKNSLKSPESLKFYDDILYIEADIEGEHHEYYYFDYTAQNSFGANVRSQYVFIDGEKRDLNEEAPKLHNAQDYKNRPDEWEKAKQENLEMLAEQRKVLDARLALDSYKLAGSNGTYVVQSEVISSKKISSKL